MFINHYSLYFFEQQSLAVVSNLANANFKTFFIQYLYLTNSLYNFNTFIILLFMAKESMWSNWIIF